MYSLSLQFGSLRSFQPRTHTDWPCWIPRWGSAKRNSTGQARKNHLSYSLLPLFAKRWYYFSRASRSDRMSVWVCVGLWL